ncbi:AI-2E family transporter [bacterium]|nr:AI-2E family transporter [bacterium]
MALPGKKISAEESLATISTVLLGAAVITALYFGRELLVPLAMAALLAFMLAPLVTRLQRWLGRVGAVLLVVAMMFATTGAAAWVVTRQAVDLINQLPSYKENIRTKLRSIQLPADGPFSKVSETIEELKKDLPGSGQPSPLQPDKTPETQAEPQQVELVKDARLEFMQSFVAPVLGPLGTAALVLLLLIFMLLQREDLRNRFIRLIGEGRISATSQAMDDAGSRVSRYILMQLIVNVTYGIPVAVGLYFIGVPNSILWGALATVLRFIPYVGPWIAASVPILLSLAVAPDWWAPLLTIGLFIVLELLSNNVMEPWLYGSSTGVTPIALIIAALVWTWLWGPLGIVLATPLTVCLVVMGRHIPRLGFLSILLSDEDPLTPAEDCYHRLHRIGEHDEMELVDNFLKANPVSALYDTVLIPVLTAAESDHRAGFLEPVQLANIEQGICDILDDLDLRTDQSAEVSADHSWIRACCVPAKAYRDQLAGEMLVRLLRQDGFDALNLPVATVDGLVESLRESRAEVVFISAVVPTTVIHVRHLCTKLRASLPKLKIVVGLWGRSAHGTDALIGLRNSGADEVITLVRDASGILAESIPVLELREVPA